MLKIAVTVPERGTPAYESGYLNIIVTTETGCPRHYAAKGSLDIIRMIQKHGAYDHGEVTFSPDAWDIFQRDIVEGVSLVKYHLKKALDGTEF